MTRMRNLGGHTPQKDNGQQTFEVVGETKYGLQDYVPSPSLAVDALVASRHPPPPDVLDPFAGDGAVLRRLAEQGWDRDHLHAIEIRKSEVDGLKRQGFGSVIIADWFDFAPDLPVDMGVVTNVPWSVLVRCVTSVLDVGFTYVASLQPLEELGGVERAGWLNDFPPTALVCLKRRMFPRAARGVAWFIWEEGQPPLDLEVR